MHVSIRCISRTPIAETVDHLGTTIHVDACLGFLMASLMRAFAIVTSLDEQVPPSTSHIFPPSQQTLRSLLVPVKTKLGKAAFLGVHDISSVAVD